MVCPNTPPGLIQSPWEHFGSDSNKGHTEQTHIHTKDTKNIFILKYMFLYISIFFLYFFILSYIIYITKTQELQPCMFSILLFSNDYTDHEKTPLSLKQSQRTNLSECT